MVHPFSGGQSFSLGLGAGVTTEAVRQEDIEVLFSFSDMIKDFKKPSALGPYDHCHFPDSLFLESDSGLKPLIDSALEPVGTGVLHVGFNVGPGAAPPPIPVDQVSALATRLRDIKKAVDNTGLNREHVFVESPRIRSRTTNR